MSDACGMVATPAREDVGAIADRFQLHLKRNPVLAALYAMMPEDQQGTLMAWWMSGYAQGRIEK